MKHKNKQNGIYSFLNASGVLEHGTDEEVKQAKKLYWKTYKKNWNKAKHKECKSFEILLNSNELKMITSHAEKNHTSPTNYIKTCALTNKQIIDRVAIGEIRELIILHNNKIQLFTEENIIPMKFGNQLIEQISLIEKRVLELFSLLK